MSRTGISHISVGTTQNGNVTNVTIPADSALGVVFYAGWAGGTLNLSSITVDGQAVAFKLGPTQESGDNSAFALGIVTGITPGVNKTVAWTQTEAPTEGAIIDIVWFDADSQLREVGGETNYASQQPGSSSSIAVTVGSVADEVYVNVQSYTDIAQPNAAPGASDQTQLSLSAQLNSHRHAIGIENTTDSPSTTMTSTGSFITSVAYVIEAAAAAEVTANAVQTLGQVAQAGVGLLEPLANAVQTLGQVVQAATASANDILADAVQTLDLVGQAAVAAAAQVGNIVQTLRALQQVASADDGSGDIGQGAIYQTVYRRRRSR